MRSWLVIPVLGAACAGVLVGLGARDPLPIVAAAACGSAFAACVRALAGDSAAGLAATILAPLLAVVTLVELHLAEPRALIALAACAWTAVELARSSLSATSPLVALVPAVLALMLDAAFAPLVPIAGARVMTAPWARPRWAFVIPIAALIAMLVRIGLAWKHAVAGDGFAEHAIAALGPLTAVAAIVGLASLARLRHAEVALAAAIACALAFGLRTGAVSAPLIGLATLSASLAIGRFAALIRIAPGQAFAGGTCAVMLLMAPAWAAITYAHGV